MKEVLMKLYIENEGETDWLSVANVGSSTSPIVLKMCDSDDGFMINNNNI